MFIKDLIKRSIQLFCFAFALGLSSGLPTSANACGNAVQPIHDDFASISTLDRIGKPLPQEVQAFASIVGELKNEYKAIQQDLGQGGLIAQYELFEQLSDAYNEVTKNPPRFTKFEELLEHLKQREFENLEWKGHHHLAGKMILLAEELKKDESKFREKLEIERLVHPGVHLHIPKTREELAAEQSIRESSEPFPPFNRQQVSPR